MLPTTIWFLLGILSIESARAQPNNGANSTTCTNPGVTGTWFNSDDGLNPCEQYLRLRSYCESDYKLPLMSSTAGEGQTPDTCSSICCCNTVAFNLAMMCSSCQQGRAVDAAKGAYGKFLNGCAPALSQDLPDSVQKTVCTEGPKLKRWEYEVYYPDDSWSYTNTKQTADQQAEAETDGAEDRCRIATTPTAAASQSPAASSAAAQESPKTRSTGISVGAVVGAVLGTVFVCGAGFFALWWFYLRGPHFLRRRDPKGGNEGHFDLLPEPNSRTPSMVAQDTAAAYVNNHYVNNAASRPRPETQTFSELTLPIPFAVPSDYNYQSSHSGTPLSPRPRDVPGGWRNGTAPSVIHSASSRDTGRSTREAAPATLIISNASATASRGQPLSP